MSLRNLACQYLNIEADSLNTIIDIRQVLMNMEHTGYATNFEFYQQSRFLILSHIKDEEERDADTDWDDMAADLKKAGFTKFINVLDFGCGIGSAGLNLKTRMPIDKLYCVDPNSYSHNFVKYRTQVNGIQNVITKWEQDPSYNLIIAWGVFEHLEDEKAKLILLKLLGNLSNNGKLFLKNFYSDTEDYRFHFDKGTEITRLFEKFNDKIIYARHSDI